jgi:hypothetical protein
MWLCLVDILRMYLPCFKSKGQCKLEIAGRLFARDLEKINGVLISERGIHAASPFTNNLVVEAD